MRIGIIVNTEYHHATALSIYESLKFLGLSPALYHHNPNDKYSLKELCIIHNLTLAQAPCFDISIVITALESNNKIPEFYTNPIFRGTNNLIFVHHRPLSCGESIIKKYFPLSKNIANGIYEKPFSENYFFQTETPLNLNASRESTIGVTSRFFENKISTEYISSFIQKNKYNVKLLGEGSLEIARQINSGNTNTTDLCSHVNFYKQLAGFKFLLMPYDSSKADYTSIRTSESLTHSIANRIPLIAHKKILKYNNLKQIDSADCNIIDILNSENKYNILIEELTAFQNNARKHNNNIFKKILEI